MFEQEEIILFIVQVCSVNRIFENRKCPGPPPRKSTIFILKSYSSLEGIVK